MSELLVDFITSLDGHASGEGWPGFWGLEGPEYLAWLGEQPGATYLMGANTYRLMSGFSAGEVPNGAIDARENGAAVRRHLAVRIDRQDQSIDAALVGCLQSGHFAEHRGVDAAGVQGVEALGVTIGDDQLDRPFEGVFEVGGQGFGAIDLQSRRHTECGRQGEGERGATCHSTRAIPGRSSWRQVS